MANDFTADMTDVKLYEKLLRGIKDRALPFATKETINRAAFETRRAARSIIGKDMTNRNTYTKNSVRVTQATGLDIRTQESIVGSIASYMATQEFGGSKTDPAIATSYSAGQKGSQRTRLPRRANQMKNIRLRGRKASSVGRTQGQRNFVAVRHAAAKGHKFVYLKGKTYEGLFRVLGGKTKPRIRMVHDLSRKKVFIPASPWLKPATARVTPRLDTFYAQALDTQLKRLGW